VNEPNRASTSFLTTIIDVLGVDPGDAAVLSVIYEGSGPPWRLRHGSLIFGPPELADCTWDTWHVENTGRAMRVGASVVDSTFAHEQNGLLIGRIGLSFAEAQEVLNALAHDELPAVGPIPGATTIGIEGPRAPIRVLPHLATPAGRLAFMASRPMKAFLFPLPDEAAATPFPDNWMISGSHVFLPDRWEAGIIASDSAGPIAPRGLLVANLERRAWIRRMRAADDELHYYEVSIGLDPTQITPFELVLELREWIGDELARATRLPLEWLDLSAWSGENHLEVTLPMFGAGGKRSVSLCDLGGELLDLSDAVFLAETIQLKMITKTLSGGTSTEHNSVIGTKLERTLEARLARAASIDDEYRKLIEDGMANRVVLQGNMALPYLQQRLEATARKEVMVVDRYFGDWQIFDNLELPVRVLVSQPRGRPLPRAGLEVRCWQQPAKRVRPPFHDRHYLWHGGGLSVGASSGGLGDSDTRIDSLDPAQAEHLAERFNELWDSDEFMPYESTAEPTPDQLR
jgi:hypothetical protein